MTPEGDSLPLDVRGEVAELKSKSKLSIAYNILSILFLGAAVVVACFSITDLKSERDGVKQKYSQLMDDTKDSRGTISALQTQVTAVNRALDKTYEQFEQAAKDERMFEERTKVAETKLADLAGTVASLTKATEDLNGMKAKLTYIEGTLAGSINQAQEDSNALTLDTNAFPKTGSDLEKNQLFRRMARYLDASKMSSTQNLNKVFAISPSVAPQSIDIKEHPIRYVNLVENDQVSSSILEKITAAFKRNEIPIERTKGIVAPVCEVRFYHYPEDFAGAHQVAGLLRKSIPPQVIRVSFVVKPEAPLGSFEVAPVKLAGDENGLLPIPDPLRPLDKIKPGVDFLKPGANADILLQEPPKPK